MIYELRNDNILVKADSTGAELKSIKRHGDPDAIEYLWQLNPDIWERQAPLLFPVIGRLKDEEYTHEGRTYKIDIHGFARFSEFDAVQESDSKVSFVLLSNEKTKEEYPFDFRLTVIYRLLGDKIIKSHVIENTGEKTMAYEIGGHEGYNLSLFPGEAMEDYYIEFPCMDMVSTYTADENIMMNREKTDIPIKDSRIYLSPEVFKDDALILDEFPERIIKLRNDKNGRGIDVGFGDFKYLGLWTKYMRSNYVCIEPWSSLPDCNYIGKELFEKIDIRLLKPGTKETLTYTIKVI